MEGLLLLCSTEFSDRRWSTHPHWSSGIRDKYGLCRRMTAHNSTESVPGGHDNDRILQRQPAFRTPSKLSKARIHLCPVFRAPGLDARWDARAGALLAMAGRSGADRRGAGAPRSGGGVRRVARVVRSAGVMQLRPVRIASIARVCAYGSEANDSVPGQVLSGFGRSSAVIA